MNSYHAPSDFDLKTHEPTSEEIESERQRVEDEKRYKELAGLCKDLSTHARAEILAQIIVPLSQHEEAFDIIKSRLTVSLRDQKHSEMTRQPVGMPSADDLTYQKRGGKRVYVGVEGF